jgi:LPXTG-motif cell wall-anchored protein
MNYKKIKTNILFSVFFVLLGSFGIFLIIFGEHDDSPGAQFLGLILFFSSAVLFYRKRKKIFE